MAEEFINFAKSTMDEAERPTTKKKNVNKPIKSGVTTIEEKNIDAALIISPSKII
jgi:hypothetical protein